DRLSATGQPCAARKREIASACHLCWRNHLPVMIRRQPARVPPARWRDCKPDRAPCVRRSTRPTVSLAHELAEDVQLEPLVVALGAIALDAAAVYAADDLKQAQDHLAAVGEMACLVGGPCRSHCLDVQADAAVVAGPFQHPDRVESPSQVDRAEGLV